MKKARKFILKKLHISLPVRTDESFERLEVPMPLQTALREPTEFAVAPLVGRTLFGKKVHRSALFDVLRYLHLQLTIAATIMVGSTASVMRKGVPARLFRRISQKRAMPDVTIREYFLFPAIIHSLWYTNHIPIPFMAFQVDKKTVGTSFRDDRFAETALAKFFFSGYRVLGWTSNYFLGYPKRISLNHISAKDVPLSDLLIATTASPAGFNQGIAAPDYFANALTHMYAEEDFPGIPNAINFAADADSPITRPVIITYTNHAYRIAIATNRQALAATTKPETRAVLFPIALLTEENARHPDWFTTPEKNVSGIMLCEKNGVPVSVSLSSTSFIRIKIHELLPYLLMMCKEAGVRFVAYLHTDDGGAMGDYYQTTKDIRKYMPLWGHCVSSLVGFVPTRDTESATQALRHWAD
jgi:hypothetical protein